MTARPPFTDAELRAYLAGAAEEDVRLAVDAALETDEALAERLAALDDFPAVAPAFDQLLARAPVEELQARWQAALKAVETAPVTPRRAWLMSGIAASIAGAFGLGHWSGRALVEPAPAPLPPPAPPTPAPRPAWLEAVAGYVRLFSDETFAAAPLGPEQRARTLSALAKAVSLDLSALARLPGLTLQRAEVLQLKGRPLGQIAYLDAQRRPLAVCSLVRPTPKEGPPPRPAAPAFKDDAVDDLNIVHWDVQPYGFLVIGRQDREALRAVAAQVAAALIVP